MKTNDNSDVLYIAFDLGSTKWVLAFSDGRRLRPRVVTIEARNLEALDQEVSLARRKLGLAAKVPVRSCFEAGRDGFWLHRVLQRQRWDNRVVDPGSLERPAKKKRAKTDRLDATQLVDRLIRHHRGEAVWSVVHVPDEATEDIRRVERERERLKHEMGAIRARIWSVLALYGVGKSSRRFPVLDRVRDPSDRPLPKHAFAELRRAYERYELLARQAAELELERKEAAAEKPRIRRTYEALHLLKGVGELSAYVLATETFGWRDFQNTRQVSASVGLAPTPHRSDQTGRELGISKAARPKMRSLMVQLAWLWLRYQPGSALTCWFNDRFANGGGRAKRVGIVALARKLYVAFWKYVTHGEVPEGALLKPAT
jgi:transposase